MISLKGKGSLGNQKIVILWHCCKNTIFESLFFENVHQVLFSGICKENSLTTGQQTALKWSGLMQRAERLVSGLDCDVERSLQMQPEAH